MTLTIKPDLEARLREKAAQENRGADAMAEALLEMALDRSDLEAVGSGAWNYLVKRPHSWKQQLYVKGRRLTASQVWLDMKANKMSDTEASENWSLPVEVIGEIVAYCESSAALLQMEADEERLFLSSRGVKLAA